MLRRAGFLEPADRALNLAGEIRVQIRQNLSIKFSMPLKHRRQLRVHAELVEFLPRASQRIDRMLGRDFFGFFEHAWSSVLELGRSLSCGGIPSRDMSNNRGVDVPPAIAMRTRARCPRHAIEEVSPL